MMDIGHDEASLKSLYENMLSEAENVNIYGRRAEEYEFSDMQTRAVKGVRVEEEKTFHYETECDEPYFIVRSLTSAISAGENKYGRINYWSNNTQILHTLKHYKVSASGKGEETVDTISHVKIYDQHKSTPLVPRNVLLKMAQKSDDFSAELLANIVLNDSLSSDTSDMGASYRQNVTTIFESSKNLDAFITSLGKHENNQSYKKYITILNSRAKACIVNNPDDSESYKLFDKLCEAGLIQSNKFYGVDTLCYPKIAEFAVSQIDGEDIFKDVQPETRRMMANVLLDNLLKKFAKPESERNIKNTNLIHKVLFERQDYNKVLPLKNLILLANNFTQRINTTRNKEVKQELLPVNNMGTVDLTNAGEAIFRILEMTATNLKHTDENRNYAEVFDALLMSDYEKFAKTKTISIADICHRYPEATEDIVLELSNIASSEGYSAASNYYRNLRRDKGRSVYFNRNKSGFGIIS